MLAKGGQRVQWYLPYLYRNSCRSVCNAFITVVLGKQPIHSTRKSRFRSRTPGRCPLQSYQSPMIESGWQTRSGGLWLWSRLALAGIWVDRNVGATLRIILPRTWMRSPLPLLWDAGIDGGLRLRLQLACTVSGGSSRRCGCCDFFRSFNVRIRDD